MSNNPVSFVDPDGGWNQIANEPGPTTLWGWVDRVKSKDLSSFRGAKSADVMKWLEQNGWIGVKTNSNRVYNDGKIFANGTK